MLFAASYLSDVAWHLANFVPNTYGLKTQALAHILNQGQAIIERYLDDMGIEAVRELGYYASRQALLDSELHNL